MLATSIHFTDPQLQTSLLLFSSLKALNTYGPSQLSYSQTSQFCSLSTLTHPFHLCCSDFCSRPAAAFKLSPVPGCFQAILRIFDHRLRLPISIPGTLKPLLAPLWRFRALHNLFSSCSHFTPFFSPHTMAPTSYTAGLDSDLTRHLWLAQCFPIFFFFFFKYKLEQIATSSTHHSQG